MAGMTRDYSAALSTAHAAAKAGNRQGAFDLGLMHCLGLGVAQDYAEAVRWYRDAADRGHRAAQTNLGFMFGTGRGVPQDFVQAYAWYNVAAAGGEDTARRNRDIIAARMSPAQVEAAQQLSAELFERIDGARPG